LRSFDGLAKCLDGANFRGLDIGALTRASVLGKLLVQIVTGLGRGLVMIGVCQSPLPIRPRCSRWRPARAVRSAGG
jgi:hypothetical protein